MEHPVIPMSISQYELSEHPLGWKTEYWDGKAHLTPREMGVKICLDLASLSPPPSQNPHPHTLIPLDESYTEQMIDGYFAAFINSVEFCDWPVKAIQDSAQRDIAGYFTGKTGAPSPASVIALEPNTQKLAGLAMFRIKGEREAHLSLLYVRWPFRRQGLATAMLHHGIHHLRQANYQQLNSRYHICNDHSRQFYHKLGFKDIFDPHYLRIKIGYLRHEISRREKLKMLAGLDQLRTEQEQLKTQLEQLNNEGIFF
ncbi:MAG: GNAT family N-acetyltransferase [Cyanobacteria bacterium P01_F01_bin.53]